MIEIKDIDDIRISLYKSLRFTPCSHLENNVFIAEGKKVTLKLLNSNIKIQSLFIISEFFYKYKGLIFSKEIAEDNIFIAEKNLMEQIVGFKLHSGVMAIGMQPDFTPLEQLDNKIVILNAVRDAENVGSIVRNAAAFKVSSLIFDEQSSSPYLRRAVRVSVGNVFDLKINKAQNLEKTILDLKSLGYQILCAEICKNSIEINKINFAKKVAIIFGNEGDGIEEKYLNLCDSICFIPISEKVDSLNVAASSAIFLYNLSKRFAYL